MIRTIKSFFFFLSNYFQAQPYFRDKRKFHLMVDPLLENQYPKKGLHQALAVAAMCLQDEDSTRPYINDVVSALDFLCDTDGKDGGGISAASSMAEGRS